MRTSAGACYALYAPENKELRPVGEWNSVRLVVKDGHAQIPDRPGNGLEWDEDKVKRWLVD